MTVLGKSSSEMEAQGDLYLPFLLLLGALKRQWNGAQHNPARRNGTNDGKSQSSRADLTDKNRFPAVTSLGSYSPSGAALFTPLSSVYQGENDTCASARYNCPPRAATFSSSRPSSSRLIDALCACPDCRPKKALVKLLPHHVDRIFDAAETVSPIWRLRQNSERQPLARTSCCYGCCSRCWSPRSHWRRWED